VWPANEGKKSTGKASGRDRSSDGGTQKKKALSRPRLRGGSSQSSGWGRGTREKIEKENYPSDGSFQRAEVQGGGSGKSQDNRSGGGVSLGSRVSGDKFPAESCE